MSENPCEPTLGCEVMRKKQPNIRNWIRVKDGRKLCPRCWLPMKYKRLRECHQRWAPFHYSWKCEICPEVYILDGSIDINENTPEKRRKCEEISQLFLTVQRIGFPEYKKSARPEPDALPLTMCPSQPISTSERTGSINEQPALSSSAIREEKEKGKWHSREDRYHIMPNNENQIQERR